MMETVYTVTTAWNDGSVDGTAMADVRVFATLEAARDYYDRERLNIHGRHWSGLWSTEAPFGPAPDEYPAHGWALAYAAPGDENGEGDPYAEDEVGMTLRAHPLLGDRPIQDTGLDPDRAEFNRDAVDAEFRRRYPDEAETCRHCGRSIVQVDGRWIDPNATGDDAVWRETCDEHDTFEADHEPVGTPDEIDPEPCSGCGQRQDLGFPHSNDCPTYYGREEIDPAPYAVHRGVARPEPCPYGMCAGH